MVTLRLVWLIVSAALITGAVWLGGGAPLPGCCG